MKAGGGSDEGDIQEAKTEARAPRRKREQAEQDARPAPVQMPAGTSQMQRGTWRTQERERAGGAGGGAEGFAGGAGLGAYGVDSMGAAGSMISHRMRQHAVRSLRVGVGLGLLLVADSVLFS